MVRQRTTRYDTTNRTGACATIHRSYCRPINDNVTIIIACKIRILFHATLSFLFGYKGLGRGQGRRKGGNRVKEKRERGEGSRTI